jgi:Tripartite tricarboxylate transporter TctB family
MNSRRIELLIDFAWVAFAGGYCAVAMGYPPGGRMVPLTVGLVALALGLLHFSGNLIAVIRPLTHGKDEDTVQIERSEIVAALWAAALLAGTFLIGAVAAVFLFFLLYFGLRRRWLLGLGSAIVMTLVTWGLFGQMIGVPLPAGLVTQFVVNLF